MLDIFFQCINYADTKKEQKVNRRKKKSPLFGHH